MSELSELFARDPLELTREDRRSIIEYYRQNRDKYIKKEPVAKLSLEEKKAAKLLEGPKKKVDISSLELDL